MTIFTRQIESKIISRLFKDRAILIFGPRQAGKTTLSKKILESFGEKGEYFNCELATVRKHFLLGQPEELLNLIGNKKIVVFDEAQTIENIGAILKIFIDTYPEIQIIATGSSSFDLANKINEPLTGRAFEFTLMPLSLSEIRKTIGLSRESLLEYMRLGTYPAIVGEQDSVVKEDLLKNLATNYLYKDIFIFESIKSPKVLENLLKALAFQLGNMVSINELSQTLGISRATVEKYIRLLEQAFVVFRLPSFSRNPRTEIKKAFKIFFFDLGVRNAVIDNISLVENRPDKGAIFENFFIVERMKKGLLESLPPKMAFWRRRDGLEIDLIEDKNGLLSAYECKWSNEEFSFSEFLKKYKETLTKIVTLETVLKDQGVL